MQIDLYPVFLAGYLALQMPRRKIGFSIAAHGLSIWTHPSTGEQAPKSSVYQRVPDLAPELVQSLLLQFFVKYKILIPVTVIPEQSVLAKANRVWM